MQCTLIASVLLKAAFKQSDLTLSGKITQLNEIGLTKTLYFLLSTMLGICAQLKTKSEKEPDMLQ